MIWTCTIEFESTADHWPLSICHSSEMTTQAKLCIQGHHWIAIKLVFNRPTDLLILNTCSQHIGRVEGGIMNHL